MVNKEPSNTLYTTRPDPLDESNNQIKGECMSFLELKEAFPDELIIGIGNKTSTIYKISGGVAEAQPCLKSMHPRVCSMCCLDCNRIGDNMIRTCQGRYYGVIEVVQE